jgi:hypothetical protein
MKAFGLLPLRMNSGWAWWYTPVISAIPEVEARGLYIQGQPGQKVDDPVSKTE